MLGPAFRPAASSRGTAAASSEDSSEGARDSNTSTDREIVAEFRFAVQRSGEKASGLGELLATVGALRQSQTARVIARLAGLLRQLPHIGPKLGK